MTIAIILGGWIYLSLGLGLAIASLADCKPDYVGRFFAYMLFVAVAWPAFVVAALIKRAVDR